MKSNDRLGMLFNSMISRCLFSYINTPHWITGECPMPLMFNVRTKLDLFKKFRGRKNDLNKYLF